MTHVYKTDTVYVNINNAEIINIMKKNEVLEELKKNFFRIAKVPGLRLRGCSSSFLDKSYDAVLKLSYGKKSIKLICLIKSVVRTITIENAIRKIESLPKQGGVKPCLVATYLSKDFRALCRKKDVAYIDLSGNIFINIPEVLYIEKGDKTNKYKDTTKLTGFFSDKKSFAIRYLFENPRKYCGVREVASACSINPGGVSQTFNSLENTGYIVRDSKGRGKLLRWKELLADWSAFYKLKRKKEYSFYWHKKSLKEMINTLARRDFPKEPQIALTVHAGAFLIAPHTNYQGLHGYVSNESDISYWEKELGLEQAKQGANVFLQIPYYKHSIAFGLKKIKGLFVVSPLQLYLDLINFPVRGEEQAEHLLKNIIKPHIENPG